MRRCCIRVPVVAALALSCLLLPPRLAGQAAPTNAPIGKEQLTTYAKAYAAIAQVRDQIQTELAAPRNKTNEAQTQLHEKMRAGVAKVLNDHGLTLEQYSRITYFISTDAELRKTLDEIMGIKPPVPPPAPAAPSGGGAAQTHLGHLTSGFTGTPNGQGLLPTALGEARVVAQHAALAARNTSDLEAMKLHAAHIVHAVEPGEGTSGPGSGYGLKKAAANIVTHIELAAKAQGAASNVTTHAVHVAASARNVVQRADQVLALAQQIQGASSATEAAALVAKLNTLAGQLMTGADANGDGQIGWQEGEGGLQHVEQHVNLIMGNSRGAQP